MAKVVSKTNPSNYSLSADTAKCSEDDWLINPPGLDTLLDKGVAARYWKVDGDDVVEMSVAEKGVVDGALETEAKDSIKAQATDDATVAAILKAIATSTGKSLTSVKTAFTGAVDGG
jgi:hypothetical protein